MVYSSRQVFGFLALICAAVGIAVFATIAIILDRRSSRHTREVIVDRETVHRLPEASPQQASDPGPPPAWPKPERGPEPQASSAMIGWIAESKAATSPRSPSVTAMVSDPIHHTPRCVSGSTCTLSSNESARRPTCRSCSAIALAYARYETPGLAAASFR